MKQYWQFEQEALEKLGWAHWGTAGEVDRERAVETVISLLKEIERLQKLLLQNK
jgi:hypothetical protein